MRIDWRFALVWGGMLALGVGIYALAVYGAVCLVK